MQTHLVTILKKMAAVDGVEKPAAALLNQSIVQANCNSNTIAFVLRLCFPPAPLKDKESAFADSFKSQITF